MQYFLLFIIALLFLWINYLIVKSDLKYKKIPNKYLGYLLLLLPFWWGFLFIIPSFLTTIPIIEFDTNIFIFISQIFLTFIFSFILYYFGIWSAGDAKYLLVLALFIPHIGIIPFIGNIALIIVIYLLLYFIWFYFGKCLFNWRYSKSLYLNIYNDLRDKWLVKKKNSKTHTIFIILKWIVIFLIIFISIRLARIYIFTGIFLGNSGEGISRIEFLKDILEKYHIYLFVLFLGLFIGFLWGIKWILNKLKKYIINKFKKKIFDKYEISPEIIDNIFLAILFVILLSFIIFEYIKNPYEIKTYLTKIFTIYLAIWGIFKILFYMYKITFSIAETYYIDIKDLKEGDIVDKEYLVKMFGFYIPNNKKSIEISMENIEYTKNIFGPINEVEIKELNKRVSKLNLFHKNQFEFKAYEKIKILNTFAFGGYIFLGFIISLILGNYFFTQIINYLLNFIKNGPLHL